MHQTRPFYKDGLCNYLSSGPIIVAMILEGENAIIKNIEQLMGSTDPKKAEEGTRYEKCMDFQSIKIPFMVRIALKMQKLR